MCIEYDSDSSENDENYEENKESEDELQRQIAGY